MKTNKNFSRELIKDIKSYWVEKKNKKISTGDAEQYLFTLAELYLSLYKIEQDKKQRV